MNELTNVTSNVNGWLPVQDGGTWRSETGSNITEFGVKISPNRLCAAKTCLGFSLGFQLSARRLPLADLGGVTVLCLQFPSPPASALHVLSRLRVKRARSTCT